MRRWRPFGARTNLRGAAATIFALTAILPLLTLVAFLWRAGLLDDARAQVNVLLALVVALLGFMLLQHLIRRIASIAHAVQDGRDTAGVAGHDEVPAVGRVSEIGEITGAFSALLAELRTSTDRLGDSVVKLSTLSELAELAARLPVLHDLLEAVLERAMRGVHASIGSIMLLDPDGRTLRLATSRGLSDVEGVAIPVGEGVAGTVAALGEPVVVEDIENDPRFAKTSAPRYGAGSFICAPVRAGERVIGVINLSKKQPGLAGTAPFTATDLYFVNTLMTNAGYAVDNARMLEETRESARRLQRALDDVTAAQTRLVQGQTLRALGELSSGMAHHLNNLLAVVLGRVDMLLTIVADPGHRERLGIVRVATLDAAEVVRRMLRFAERQQSSLTTAVDLNALVREVLELLRPRWGDEAHLRGVHIEIALDLGTLPTTAGDPSALREVLMNLLVNAFEALPGNGRVAVKTWVAERAIHCAITDSGCGMSDELRGRAAEPFFTTKGPQGIGLGLSATYGILEQHGGDLTISSAEGRGTTVTVRVPIRVAPTPLEPDADDTAPLRPLRILLVDDEEPVRRVLVEMLASAGHAVVDVESGREALLRLERGEPFDVVLTDLGMPGMTGHEVARAVKARWPKLPVVLITGWPDHADGAPDDGGADLTIRKPITRDGLRVIARVVPAG